MLQSACIMADRKTSCCDSTVADAIAKKEPRAESSQSTIRVLCRLVSTVGAGASATAQSTAAQKIFDF